MSQVPDALYGRLSGDEVLTTMLASTQSIYHEFAPEEAKPPYIEFALHTGSQEWSFRSFYRNQIWLVKAITRSEPPLRAEQIDARIEALLDDAPLDLGADRLMYLRRETDVSYAEVDGGELICHRGGLYRLLSEPV